ncbi:MAG: methyltransferase domain-containing protein [Patescibacteria group bacterium]
MIPDQKEMWNRKHKEGEHTSFQDDPSSLALLAEPKFSEHSTILELGCGVGRDAAFFAQNGHKVNATDLSEVVIKQNQQRLVNLGIEFSTLDMQKPLPYPDSSFDTVYANLSIHYFEHKTTQEIIDEINRVLKPGGLFVFTCKSINDFHHGNGEEVEESVFVSPKGHVRHLFSISYTEELLANLFKIDLLKEVEEEYSGEKSVMIQCIAKKTGKKLGRAMKFTKSNARETGWDGLKLWVYNSKEDFPNASAAYFEVTKAHGRIKTTKSNRVYYVLGGEGVFDIDGEKNKAQEGDVFIVPKNTPYDYWATDGTVLRLFLVDAPAFDPKHEVKLDE